MKNNNFIPYITFNTSKGELKLLIDSGSNRNYLARKHVNFEKCRITQPTTVRNVSGSHVIDRFVEFNPFPNIPNTSKQIFLVFDFHPFFDGLIGYETLKNLKADIITSLNKLRFPSGEVPMKRKYPVVKSVYLNAHETKPVDLTTKSVGDFFSDRDLTIDPHCFIHSGLYRAENGYVKIFLTNRSSEPCRITLTADVLEMEVNNFECSTPDVPHNINPVERNALFDQLRTDHLNADEKHKLLKIISRHTDVFFLKGERLSFTNAIKHSINTKDESPIHTKSSAIEKR